MAKESGPLIPLGILLDPSLSAGRAVRVLNAFQIDYENAITRAACEAVLGRLDRADGQRRKSRDLLVKRERLEEQLKDYENFKSEGRGRSSRFVVDERKLRTLLASDEQRNRVDTDIAEKIYEFYKVSR